MQNIPTISSLKLQSTNLLIYTEIQSILTLQSFNEEITRIVKLKQSIDFIEIFLG